MADVVSSEKRSEMMSGIRSRNTQPEMVIRKLLYARGFRYRLHPKDIPGKPDIVFRQKKVAIFVNGCFWHGHDCHLFKIPKTNTAFWQEKIEGNRNRDVRNQATLEEDGWRVVHIWECEIRKMQKSGQTDEVLGKIVPYLQ